MALEEVIFSRERLCLLLPGTWGHYWFGTTFSQVQGWHSLNHAGWKTFTVNLCKSSFASRLHLLWGCGPVRSISSGASSKYKDSSSSSGPLVDAQHPGEKGPSFPVLSSKKKKHLPEHLANFSHTEPHARSKPIPITGRIQVWLRLIRAHLWLRSTLPIAWLLQNEE